jgi:hypothetical protein
MDDRSSTLIIGVFEGGSFYVDDLKCTVTKIVDEVEFHLLVDTPAMTQEFVITDRRMTPILTNPLVLVGAGSRGSKTTARVMIKAPRKVTILREKLYKKSHGSPVS